MSHLIVATGESVVRLQEEDGSWAAETLLEGKGVQCVTVDARQPDRLIAGSRGSGVWCSQDGGVTWNNPSLPSPDVFSVAVSPADGAVYAGTEPSRLFRSRDSGETWEELESLQQIPSRPTWSFPPRPWTSHVRWIAPNPQDPDLLLVGIELGGMMYSGDGGRSWLDHRPGAQPDVHAVTWHPSVSGRAYEAGGGGAAWSHDGGMSWDRVDEGRDRHYTWGLAVDPTDPDCWFISASPGPREAHSGGHAEAGIYRWRGNGPWEKLQGGLPQPLDQFPYALACDHNRLFAGLGDGRIFASADGGDTWSLLNMAGDPLPSIAGIVWDSQNLTPFSMERPRP